MKNVFAFLVLLFCLSIPAHAQTSAPTQVYKVFAGQSITFSWDYDVDEEFLITHFSFRLVDDLTKTTIELKTVPKNLRSVTINTSFSSGLKFMYYNVYAVNSSVTPAVSSGPSNTVATERVGKPPRNLVAN